MDNIIEIKNVSKIFDKGKKTVVKALDNVSISVKKGEIFGLLGSNGAGKTTLINILVGLLTRDSGRISMLGMNFDKRLDEIKPRINIVSGFTMVCLSLSVREYLNYFSMLYDVKEIEKVVDNAIKLVGLESKRNTLVKNLSSGYKQRVLLAKGLLNNPEIIFMDEPTVGLDVSVAIRIRKLISKLKAQGTTIIFTSHNLSEVEQLCDRITLISNGKIIESGSIKEIKKRIMNNKIIEVICKKTNDLAKMVKKLKQVENVEIVGNNLIIKAKTTKDVDFIMKKIINSNYIIISIRKIEPTLEEAFLHIMDKEE